MRNSPFTTVYDACVLDPAPLWDFLMWLGRSGRFRAGWDAQIHDEWHRKDLTSDLMDRSIPDTLVRAAGH